MRTSNKILLATFIAVIIVLTSVHVALYAKMKSGHAVAFVPEIGPDRFNHHQITSKKFVSARGLKNFKIVSSSAPMLNIEKHENSSIEYLLSGDSLHINTGNKGNSSAQDGSGERGREEVILYLPGIQGLVMEDCNLTISGEGDSTHGRSFAITSSNSEIIVGGDYGNSSRNYFSQLRIDGVNSIVRLLNETTVADLEINLRGFSELHDEGVRLSQLRGSFGDSTVVRLQGQTLRKLTIQNR